MQLRSIFFADILWFLVLPLLRDWKEIHIQQGHRGIEYVASNRFRLPF